MAFSSTRALLGAAGGVGSIIQSVQQVSITISSSSSSNTATLSPSVNTSNCMLIYGGLETGNTGGLAAHSGWGMRFALTNSTTVTATRTDSPTYAVTGTVTVVEFISGVIDSRQEFVANMVSASTTTDTITSVNTSNTSIFQLGSQGSSGSISTSGLFSAETELASSTSVKTTRTSSSGNLDVGIQVIEWNSAFIDSIQRLDVNLTLVSGSQTTTITSIDLDRTFLGYGGWGVTGGSSARDRWFRTRIQNATTVQVQDAAGISTAQADPLTQNVIEFATGLVASVQRGSISKLGSDGATKDATITAVDTTKTFVNFMGFAGDDNSYTDTDELPVRLFLQDSTTVRMSGATGGGASNSVQAYYEVIEFL